MSLQSVDDFLQFLDRIQGLPAVALVCGSCIAVGYGLRFIRPFPNNAIPVVVILWGALFMLLIADPRANSMPARVWTVRNILVGLILGFLSWMAHYFVLSWIEKKLRAVSWIGDTAFIPRDKSGLTSGGASVKVGETDKPTIPP